MSYLCADRYASYSGMSLSISASRSTGIGPLAVWFVATASDPNVTYPYHQLYYWWDFGDSGSGNFSYGSTSVKSRNFASGPVACHVFSPTEGGGDQTYTVTLYVFDGYATKSTTTTITAYDPGGANGYAGTKTICISSGALSSGGPAGCIYRQNVANLQTQIAADIGSGTVRFLLFGNTFTNAVTINQPSVTIGKMTGQSPVISTAGIPVTISANDCRVMDLGLTGMGANNGGVQAGSNLSQLTMLRINSHDATGYGIKFDPGAYTLSQIAIQDSTITNISNGANGYGAFIGGDKIAMMGNLIDTVTSHAIRNPWLTNSVISNNTTTGAGLNNLDINGTGANTSLVCTNYNKWVGSTASTMVKYAAQQDSDAELLSDIISDGNWFVAGSATQYLAISRVSYLTQRNNILNMSIGSNPASGITGISILGAGGAPASATNWIYNNSFYSSDNISTNGAFSAITLASAVTGIVGKNNIAWAPTGTGTRVFLLDNGATAPSFTNNTSDANVKSAAVRPYTSATPANPTDFAPYASASPAVIGQGATVPVYDDFASTRRSYGNTAPTLDMGAIKGP